MPNVYLQKDLGMIGDLLHSYRELLWLCEKNT
jgi:hypothetical protein